MIDGVLGAAGTSAAAVGFDKLAGQGVLYQGISVLGGGSILTGLVLGAIGIFTIERKFIEASAFALAGAVLTFFGFMHGEAIGLAVTPAVAVAYVLVAAFLYGLSRYPAVTTDAPPLAHAVATPAE
jgi:AGZA family xanthine/uracil permease-like MFS transporter